MTNNFFFRRMLLFLLLCSLFSFVYTNSCNLPPLLTNNSLQHMQDGCITIIGNLQINTSVSYEMLTRKFKKATSVFGCVSIKNTNLRSFDFMKRVRVINCSLNSGNESLNVIDVRDNVELDFLSWHSLKTIIGPGRFHIGGVPLHFCLTMNEIELYMLHPKYSGTGWTIGNYQGQCGAGCSLKYFFTPQQVLRATDSTRMFRKGCRVINDFRLDGPGQGYIPLMDDLRDVRIIIGEFGIYDTFLSNLSFFPNLEMIFTSEGIPLRLSNNRYMSNISLPKLRRLIGPEETLVLVEDSPLLETSNPFLNVTTSNRVIITSRRRLDSYAFEFNLIIYGMYGTGLTISILFNLRAVVLFVFGCSGYALGALRWFYVAFAMVHLLIAFDSIIFYHDLSPVYFTPAPLLRNVILYNDALFVFCKTMFVTREIAMYIPIAAVIYIYISIAMALFHRKMKIPALIYLLTVAVCCILEANSLYSSVDVRARRTMNKLYGIEGDSPMNKYSIIAGRYGMFSLESFIDPNKIVYFEKTIYTDGLDITQKMQQLEYISIGLFVLYFLIKKLDRADRLSKLPYDNSVIVLVLQYFVLRYAELRNYLIREMFSITCFGRVKCAEQYTYDHSVTMITHHFVYVLMAICSLFAWYTARHFHLLGCIIKKEKKIADAIQAEKSTVVK